MKKIRKQNAINKSPLAADSTLPTFAVEWEQNGDAEVRLDFNGSNQVKRWEQTRRASAPFVSSLELERASLEAACLARQEARRRQKAKQYRAPVEWDPRRVVGIIVLFILASTLWVGCRAFNAATTIGASYAKNITAAVSK